MAEDLVDFNYLFQCHKHYYIGEVYNVGLLDYDKNNISKSLHRVQTFCYFDEAEIKNFGDLISFQTLKKIVEDDCVAKSACNPTVKYKDIWQGKKEDINDLAYTVFFGQVSCIASEDHLSTKMYLGLVCSTLGLFMAVAFRLTITHIQNKIEIDDKLLDYGLVSIEDYSITGNIS